MTASPDGVTRQWMCAALCVAALAGCAVSPPAPSPGSSSSDSSTPVPTPPTSPTRPSTPPPSTAAPSPRPPPAVVEGVVAQNDHFVLYRPKRDDTLRSVAQQFLGDEKRGWEIADFNDVKELTAGNLVAIPLRPVNPVGVFPDGYQTVPILAYHRFGDKNGKMVVTPEAFAAQMKYLAEHDYRVIPMADLVEFLAGKRSLPQRAVVITADDGYASVYRHAYPVLKQYGFPATVFVYTDFIGAGDALTWPQMQEMIASGLIDIESHSKSHESLVAMLPGESERSYRARVDKELTVGRDVLQRKLGVHISIFAYPYGDASAAVVERAQKADYQLAVTVNPGGNPFFAQPLLLQRTMIFGDHDIEAFKARLQTFHEVDLK
jgi:peptidoglycan/xylan/chitin deacetylase (PgdA/CDA1 family)